jgi:hypothetical protein
MMLALIAAEWLTVPGRTPATSFSFRLDQNLRAAMTLKRDYVDPALHSGCSTLNSVSVLHEKLANGIYYAIFSQHSLEEVLRRLRTRSYL